MTATDHVTHDSGLPANDLPEAPSVRSRRRWLILGIGVGAQASFAAAFQGLPAAGTALRSAYQLSDTQLGWALSGISLGIAVTEVGWGAVTDRVGERRILAGGLAATAAALAAMAFGVVPRNGFVPGVVLLTTAFFLTGVLGGSVNGSSGRAVMGWFDAGERGFAMSIRQTAVPLGGAVGAAALPWLAITHGFAAVYGVLAAACLIACLASLRWLRDPGSHEAIAPPPPTERQRTSPLRRRDVWRVAVSGGLFTCPQFAILTFSAVYLHDVHHVAVTTTSLVIVATQIIGGSCRIALGKFSDRYLPDRKRTVRLMGYASAIGFIAVAALVNGPVWASIVLLIAAGTIASAWHGIAYAEIAEMAGHRRSATALGMENTMVFVGAFVIPIIIPAMLFLGWDAAWVVVAVTAVLAAVVMPRGLAR